MASKIFDFLKNSKKFFRTQLSFTFSNKNFYSKFSLKKIAALNFSLLFNYFCFTIIENKRKKIMMNFSKSTNFDYLLNLDNLDDQEKIKNSNKKTPKIIYLSNSSETDEDKIRIRANFEKMHSKFSDLDSYVVEMKRRVDSLSELENFLKLFKIELKDLLRENEIEKSIKENLLERPFMIINKYGDVKNYSSKEFSEISKPDSNFHFLEKLQILNNKNDLLLLNDYDYAFVIYLDNKNVDYSTESFKIFRKMFFLLNFFNIKFFVATKEHSEFLTNNKINLELNNVYLIKRENMLDELKDNTQSENSVTYEEESFKVFDLTAEILKEKTSDDSKINF
jgi:hypothetical protein